MHKYKSRFSENTLPTFEEFCNTSYGSIEEALDNMYVDILSISAWFTGYTGMTKKKLPSKTKLLYTNLSEILKAYFNPNVIGNKIYRLSNINVSNIDTVKKLYKQSNLKIGPKDILSFTVDKLYLYKFYKKFYEDSASRSDNRFAFVIISTICDKNNYIMDYNTLYRYLNYLYTNLMNLKTYNKNDFKELLDILKRTIKMLSDSFYREQKEVVLQYEESKTKIKIEDIVYSKKFNVGN